jgi:hypothetical protein
MQVVTFMSNVLEINKNDRLGEDVYSHDQLHIAGVAE